MSKVCCISVVRDFAMYERCVKSNPLLAGCGLCTIDNRGRNDGVPACYNRFLDSRSEDEDAWYVFCHEDFQMMEPLAPRLEKLDTEALWGPIGAVTREETEVARRIKGGK